MVCVHHTFRVARGARGKEHRAHIVCMRFVNFSLPKIGVLLGKHRTSGQQFFE